jgi:hypothetical protein
MNRTAFRTAGPGSCCFAMIAAKWSSDIPVNQLHQIQITICGLPPKLRPHKKEQ